MAEGEDWQDRISSQNIEKTDKSSIAGSANSEGESWQDRISSGTKDQEKTKDPLLKKQIQSPFFLDTLKQLK